MLAKALQHILLPLLYVADRVDAEAVQFLRSLLTYSIQGPHLAVDHEIHKVLLHPDLEIAVRLLFFARCFGCSLGISDADRACKTDLTERPGFDLPCHLSGALKTPGAVCHIQICLVQSYGLHFDRIVVPYPADLLRDLPVFIEVGMHVDAVGTASVCFLDIHGRMDTVFSRFIAAGRDHAALCWQRAYDERLSCK